jgi:hypothetical protein
VWPCALFRHSWKSVIILPARPEITINDLHPTLISFRPHLFCLHSSGSSGRSFSLESKNSHEGQCPSRSVIITDQILCHYPAYQEGNDDRFLKLSERLSEIPWIPEILTGLAVQNDVEALFFP